MDLQQLMQQMKNIEEGLDLPVEECGGDMPAIIQGGPPADDSLNMNLTINSKGSDGLRELINVLKGIGGDEPKDSPQDGERLFGTDDEEHAIVIGDNYENSINGDAGEKVFPLDALIHQGDKKDREAHKVNGGGNPQMHETLMQNLSSLYEEIKNRS